MPSKQHPSLFNTTKPPKSKSPYPNLLMGTCSWKYDSWKGLIYDPNKSYAPNDYLSDYAKYYSTVEIDEWFWSLFPQGIKLPNPETVKSYAQSVPEDFIFTVKAPNSITLTHYYARQPARYKHIANLPNSEFLNIDLLKRFLDTLEPMKRKIGSIIFQFEYLNKEKMSSLKQFMDKLNEFFEAAPKEFDYALEVRNPAYLTQDLSQFLKERNISPVLIEGYYMPPLNEVVNSFDISIGKTLIIRLQGSDRMGIEKLSKKKWDRVVSPQDDSIDRVAEILKKQVKTGKTVIVNVNNHYEGCAPLTIERIVEKIQ